MRIGQVFDRIYDDAIGWRPSTGAIKPVHIANGMFRALAGEQHNIGDIIAFIVWWRRKNEKIRHEERTFERLVTANPDGPFGAFGRDADRFEQARDAARAILGADGAVFPDAAHSSLTLTCRQMISPDDFDRGLGAFAAALIAGQDGEGALAGEVRRALDVVQPDDPVSTLAWPLLDTTGRRVERPAPPAVGRLAATAPDYVAALEAAATSLASHEADQGNRLRTLQRAVHLACVSTHSHVQTLVAGGNLEARTPLLLSIGAAKGSALTSASEASLSLLYDRFEAWLVEQLATRLAAGEPLHETEAIDPGAIRASSHESRLYEVLAAIGPSGRAQEQAAPADLARRAEDLDFALSLAPAPEAKAQALAHALWLAYRREYVSGGPREFLTRIGRWSGLIYPYFQGKSRDKRVRPNVMLLDMLVRACVAAGEVVPLDEFLDRLWVRFGLIAGGRGDGQHDAALLRRHGLNIDAGQLVGNAEALVDQLVRLGMARRYADDVTFVGRVYAN